MIYQCSSIANSNDFTKLYRNVFSYLKEVSEKTLKSTNGNDRIKELAPLY